MDTRGFSVVAVAVALGIIGATASILERSQISNTGLYAASGVGLNASSIPNCKPGCKYKVTASPGGTAQNGFKVGSPKYETLSCPSAQEQEALKKAGRKDVIVEVCGVDGKGCVSKPATCNSSTKPEPKPDPSPSPEEKPGPGKCPIPEGGLKPLQLQKLNSIPQQNIFAAVILAQGAPCPTEGGGGGSGGGAGNGGGSGSGSTPGGSSPGGSAPGGSSPGGGSGSGGSTLPGGSGGGSATNPTNFDEVMNNATARAVDTTTRLTAQNAITDYRNARSRVVQRQIASIVSASVWAAINTSILNGSGNVVGVQTGAPSQTISSISQGGSQKTPGPVQTPDPAFFQTGQTGGKTAESQIADLVSAVSSFNEDWKAAHKTDYVKLTEALKAVNSVTLTQNPFAAGSDSKQFGTDQEQSAYMVSTFADSQTYSDNVVWGQNDSRQESPQDTLNSFVGTQGFGGTQNVQNVAPQIYDKLQRPNESWGDFVRRLGLYQQSDNNPWPWSSSYQDYTSGPGGGLHLGWGEGLVPGIGPTLGFAGSQNNVAAVQPGTAVNNAVLPQQDFSQSTGSFVSIPAEQASEKSGGIGNAIRNALEKIGEVYQNTILRMRAAIGL